MFKRADSFIPNEANLSGFNIILTSSNEVPVKSTLATPKFMF